jgi:non-ribosomal peptide synthetase component F
MSDSPNPPHSQPPEVASVAASPNRSQEIKLKLSDYQWQYRILLLFAPSTGSADYRQQLQAWQADVAGTDDRDLKLVQILGTGESQVDRRSLNAASAERLRQQFGITPEAFAVILVGKDGTEKQRSQTSIALATLFRTIDALPMRQQELHSRQ